MANLIRIADEGTHIGKDGLWGSKSSVAKDTGRPLLGGSRAEMGA